MLCVALEKGNSAKWVPVDWEGGAQIVGCSWKWMNGCQEARISQMNCRSHIFPFLSNKMWQITFFLRIQYYSQISPLFMARCLDFILRSHWKHDCSEVPLSFLHQFCSSGKHLSDLWFWCTLLWNNDFLYASRGLSLLAYLYQGSSWPSA